MNKGFLPALASRADVFFCDFRRNLHQLADHEIGFRAKRTRVMNRHVAEAEAFEAIVLLVFRIQLVDRIWLAHSERVGPFGPCVNADPLTPGVER